MQEPLSSPDMLYFQLVCCLGQALIGHSHVCLATHVGERGAHWTTYVPFFLLALSKVIWTLILYQALWYMRTSMVTFCISLEFLKIKSLGGSLYPMYEEGWPIHCSNNQQYGSIVESNQAFLNMQTSFFYLIYHISYLIYQIIAIVTSDDCV